LAILSPPTTFLRNNVVLLLTLLHTSKA